MRLFLLFSLLLITSTGVVAQKQRAATQHVQDAELAINMSRWKQAKKELLDAISEKEDMAIAHRFLGLVHLRLAEYEEAVKAFEHTFELNPWFSRAAYFECGEARMKLGLYSQALDCFNFYQEYDNERSFNSDDSKTEKSYAERLPGLMRSCKFAVMDAKDMPVALIHNLGPSVNTEYDEYLPAVNYEGTILLYTSQSADENIVVSYNKDGIFQQGKVSTELNTRLNEGMARFTPCGNEIYYAGCQRRSRDGGCDIFKADFIDGKISQGEPVNGNINSEYWDSQPSVTCDGSRMYFSSNRPGGVGGTDIWASDKQPDGSWGVPFNLGPVVNTPGDEETPYIAMDGITLYYSSDGLPGYGDADLFRTVGKDTIWTKPQNLGPGINSSFREAGFSLNYSDRRAYFASARSGGMGGLDLYEADLPEALRPDRSMTLLRGTVYGIDKKPLDARIRINQAGKTVAKTQASDKGYFSICLADNKMYSLIVDKTGYETFINAQTFAKTAAEPVTNLNIVLQRPGEPGSNMADKVPVVPVETDNKPVPLSAGSTSIFFPSGTADLNKEQALKLTELFNKFDISKPMTIHVVGFADEDGNANTNLMLSQKRAKAVVDFFKNMGVPDDQVSAVGKGEDRGRTSDNKSSRRRVEVYITQ